MKKVLCLIDSLGLGGAERQMVGLSVLLKEKGYIVDLVTYHIDDDYSHIARKGCCNPIVLSVKNTPLSKFLAVYRFIKNKGGYDCVITYKSGPNAIGCLLKVIGLKTKLIVSERSYSQILNRRIKTLFFLYGFADSIVPNSYSQANLIKCYNKSLSKKMAVITNYTNTQVFIPGGTTPVLTTRKFYVMTAARITKAKNIINYLKAIRLVKERGYRDIHFDWYGNVHAGEESYGEEVFRKVLELDIEDMIMFRPATKNIAEEYQKCDIFCLPSIYEGFPNVICEAMSCGKPIICSRVCDNPYIVKEGENALLFDCKQIEDIADKIVMMYEKTREELTRWGYRSREIAVNLFSADTFVNKYIELIEK